MKNGDELRGAGFTESGITKYEATARDYCDDIFAKAVALGDRDKAHDMPREVTHEHVRGAAIAIVQRSRSGSTRTQVFCQAGEYVCAALAGLGAGKLETPWGIALFGISLTLGVILFVIRSMRGSVQ